MEAGRPRVPITKDQFEGLCRLQCSLPEFAGFFHCSEDTIQNFCEREYGQNFSAVYKEFAQQGKISLRRYMWKHCEKSWGMCVFMAKNMLGYKDNGQETDNTQEMCDKLADSILKLAQTQKGGGGNDTTDH